MQLRDGQRVQMTIMDEKGNRATVIGVLRVNASSVRAEITRASRKDVLSSKVEVELDRALIKPVLLPVEADVLYLGKKAGAVTVPSMFWNR